MFSSHDTSTQKNEQNQRSFNKYVESIQQHNLKPAKTRDRGIQKKMLANNTCTCLRLLVVLFPLQIRLSYRRLGQRDDLPILKFLVTFLTNQPQTNQTKQAARQKKKGCQKTRQISLCMYKYMHRMCYVACHTTIPNKKKPFNIMSFYGGRGRRHSSPERRNPSPTPSLPLKANLNHTKTLTEHQCHWLEPEA